MTQRSLDRAVEIKPKEYVNKDKNAAAVSPKEPVEKSASTEAVKESVGVQELNKVPEGEQHQKEIAEKVETAVETIRGFIQENQRDLDFDVAQESNRVIITVKDKVTNEVIRQIPPEDAIEMAERIESGEDITTSGVLLQGQA